MWLFLEIHMNIYKNENFAHNELTQSGPYTFKNGLIQIGDDADETVGHVLTTYYGCRKLEADEIKALVKERKTAAAAEAKAQLQADAVAKLAAEEKAKADALAQEEADKLEAEEKAAAEAKANETVNKL